MTLNAIDRMKKSLLNPHGSDTAIEISLEPANGSHPNAYRYRMGDMSGEVENERTDAGEGWLRREGAVIPYHVLRREDQVFVWLAGKTYTFDVLDGTARRTENRVARAGPRSERLTAPMPGMILKIVTHLGESFAAHQPLIIMESMKMELTRSVPHAGRVQEITCREGQLVEMGALLVRIDADHE